MLTAQIKRNKYFLLFDEFDWNSSELRGLAPPAIARHERAGPIGIMK